MKEKFFQGCIVFVKGILRGFLKGSTVWNDMKDKSKKGKNEVGGEGGGGKERKLRKGRKKFLFYFIFLQLILFKPNQFLFEKV